MKILKKKIKKQCKHKWVFDYHYLDKREYHSYANEYSETAIYHCENCGEAKRHPVWTDKYENNS